MFVSRLVNLIRGKLSQWMKTRERRDPAAVYEAAIDERQRQYVRLREAAASILYMRNKLGRQLEETRTQLENTVEQLDLAVDRDDDEAALFLIGRKDRLTEDVERIKGELEALTREAEAAKRNLTAFQSEIQRLRDEKARNLARLANAEARLKLQSAIAGLSPDADIAALEGVREYVERTVSSLASELESGDASLDARLGKIRQEQASQAARAQLDELKRSRRGPRVPLLLPVEPVVMAR
ncbi:MAG TPA: PspA/IM30 family protein [Candidatus Limnocylindrales bacterium]|nr:PspA/IM30 family protein [Candidatus Limnocylindrales bacterium]